MRDPDLLHRRSRGACRGNVQIVIPMNILATVGIVFRLVSPCPPLQDVGNASWYGREYRGHVMANGDKFDERDMVCASWFYPLGTRLKVSVVGAFPPRSVYVVVTDRGPAWRLVLRKHRIVDLSWRAFASICSPSDGEAYVCIEPQASRPPEPKEPDMMTIFTPLLPHEFVD